MDGVNGFFLRAEKRTNKLNPHMTLSLEIEPRVHCWEASALTTTPPLLSVTALHLKSSLVLLFILTRANVF